MKNKLTITLPEHLLKKIDTYIPNRKKSQFIAEAVNERLIQLKTSQIEDPVTKFISFRNKLPKYSTQKILKLIDEGKK